MGPQFGSKRIYDVLCRAYPVPIDLGHLMQETKLSIREITIAINMWKRLKMVQESADHKFSFFFSIPMDMTTGSV